MAKVDALRMSSEELATYQAQLEAEIAKSAEADSPKPSDDASKMTDAELAAYRARLGLR